MQSGKALHSLEIRYLFVTLKSNQSEKQTQVDIYEALEGLPPTANRPMMSGLEAEDRLLQQAIAASMQEGRPGGNMDHLPLEQEEEGGLDGQREDELTLALRLSQEQERERQEQAAREEEEVLRQVMELSLREQ